MKRFITLAVLLLGVCSFPIQAFAQDKSTERVFRTTEVGYRYPTTVSVILESVPADPRLILRFTPIRTGRCPTTYKSTHDLCQRHRPKGSG
jgi:hypothetical protein